MDLAGSTEGALHGNLDVDLATIVKKTQLLLYVAGADYGSDLQEEICKSRPLETHTNNSRKENMRAIFEMLPEAPIFFRLNHT